VHGPEVVCWLLVALCGAAGAYCLGRLRHGTAAQRQAAGVEAAMGLGMAVMSVPASAAPGPPPAALAAVFGATALWAALLPAARPAHRAHHALEALAMVYATLAMGGAGGAAHAGHAAGANGVPALTGALLAYFAVYAVRSGARLTAGTGAAAGPPGQPPPEVAAACRLTLALGTFTMLLTL
jgi:hypothetical protein